MNKIKILQVGLGPVGQKVLDHISRRVSLSTVAAVDLDPKLEGKDLGETFLGGKNGIQICDSIDAALKNSDPDVALVTTVSDLAEMEDTLTQLIDWGIPVITSCEEMSFPWVESEALSHKIDSMAKENHVAVLGTGVNPGFLMDSLPCFLSTLNNRVDSITIERHFNAGSRRVPFQNKVGIGMSPVEFDQSRDKGKVGHVGLIESAQFMAHRMGWTILEHQEEILPSFAQAETTVGDRAIGEGKVIGISQNLLAQCDGGRQIQLKFEASANVEESYDEIRLVGDLNISSRIEGGVNGDSATASVLLNSIPSVLRSEPGLKTMGDIPLTSYFM